MKRSDYFDHQWQALRGILKPSDSVSVAGAGASGLHLAVALAARGIKVTLFEPALTGGLRIPLMHACHSTKPKQPLWEAAAAWARIWYRDQKFSTDAVDTRENMFGKYFVIKTRRYLRDLQQHAMRLGVKIRRQSFTLAAADTPDCRMKFLASGEAAAPLLESIAQTATQLLPGLESYFANVVEEPLFSEPVNAPEFVATNLMRTGSRAAYIHRNRELDEVAHRLGRELYPEKRAALFRGTRLTTRDRLPVVGLLPDSDTPNFLFCAMGYHAMTYTPFLAEKIAAWLCNEYIDNGNLICGLTPARFLPRDRITNLRSTV